ncbi:MAG: DegV family protein [Clostridiales bacterium]|nr:DegV family protein [Clostridiales bacterium]
MKIAISVESTNDLSKELLQKYDIKVIPYHITLGNKSFLDGEMSTVDLFAHVDETKTLPKTNAINEFEFIEYFQSIKKDYDAVIHVSLSSGLSSSCANAKRASQNVENVFVIDSQSLSTGIGLLAIYASELALEGLEPSIIVQKVQDRVRDLQVSFVIERLDYLHKGGRCNLLSLLGATIFKIRPRIVVKNGKMSSDKKYKGSMAKVVKKYCEDVLEENSKPELDKVFLTYTTATPEMIEQARAVLVEKGFKNIYETHAGCTIASHCGANTLGILFFNSQEK